MFSQLFWKDISLGFHYGQGEGYPQIAIRHPVRSLLLFTVEKKRFASFVEMAHNGAEIHLFQHVGGCHLAIGIVFHRFQIGCPMQIEIGATEDMLRKELSVQDKIAKFRIEIQRLFLQI